MFAVSKIIKFTILNALIFIPPLQSMENKKIKRIDFIKDIYGKDEENLRKEIGWNPSNCSASNYNPETISFNNNLSLEEFIKEYHRRAAIFHGDFSENTIDQLTEESQKITVSPKARFNVILFDPLDEKMTNVLSIQADPKNNGNTAIQLASTFSGPLEGGMDNPHAYLEHMFPHNVQGEDATTGCAGAAIWRKYFMPTNRKILNLNSYLFLLANLAPKITNNNNRINYSDILKYSYDPKDIKKVIIPIHKDIVVGAGYGGHNAQDPQEQLIIGLKKDGTTIDPNKTQLTTHIFTSAYNLMNALENNKYDNKEVQNFAKMILNAAYEGTIKASIAAKKPHLVLTLVGGGAFRNRMSWISDSLNRPECKDSIKKSGLNVDILYRPDKYREQDISKKWPVRTVAEDFIFIKELIKIADEINKTELHKNSDIINLIEFYTKNAYALMKDSNNGSAKEACSMAAKELNKILKQ